MQDISPTHHGGIETVYHKYGIAVTYPYFPP